MPHRFSRANGRNALTNSQSRPHIYYEAKIKPYSKTIAINPRNKTAPQNHSPEKTIMPSADRKHRRRSPSPRPQQRLLPQQHKHDDLALDGASFSGAVFNLSTTVVGAGIMALPAAVKQLGMVSGLIVIVLGAIITDASIEMILRFSRASKAASYSGLVGDTFGGVGRTLLQGCIVVNNVSTLVVYMIIIGIIVDFSGTNYSNSWFHFTQSRFEW